MSLRYLLLAISALGMLYAGCEDPAEPTSEPDPFAGLAQVFDVSVDGQSWFDAAKHYPDDGKLFAFEAKDQGIYAFGITFESKPSGEPERVLNFTAYTKLTADPTFYHTSTTLITGTVVYDGKSYALDSGTIEIHLKDTERYVISGSFNFFYAGAEKKQVTCHFQHLGLQYSARNYGSITALISGRPFDAKGDAEPGSDAHQAMASYWSKDGSLHIQAVDPYSAEPYQMDVTLAKPVIGENKFDGEKNVAILKRLHSGAIFRTHPGNIGAITITSYDKDTRRLNGSFEFNARRDLGNDSLRVTEGALKNVVVMPDLDFVGE